MYRKGYVSERELKIFLEKQGWTVIRSGGSKKPDLIAGKEGKILVIECKATKSKAYVDPEEIEALKITASQFNGTPLLAVRCSSNRGDKWKLIPIDDLKRSGKFFVASTSDSEQKTFLEV